ncbi:hypothetical protein CCR75_005499 [Bremia lactucae]|uniref:Uncharacterized protein n=1 Tax=Bremia lactucae TaxID=4779 RepID=A0A976NZ53_BRELC|nr:hypothetical protein CCR75_005499 [Bremia lactucae]
MISLFSTDYELKPCFETFRQGSNCATDASPISCGVDEDGAGAECTSEAQDQRREEMDWLYGRVRDLVTTTTLEDIQRNNEDLIKVVECCAWYERPAQKRSHEGAQDYTIRLRNELLRSADPGSVAIVRPQGAKGPGRALTKGGSVSEKPWVKIADED